MKKVFALCILLAVLAVAAFAGKHETVVSATSPAANPKAEIQSIVDQIAAIKAAGQVPDAALYARLNELQAQPATPRHTLDQGADACPATVIASLPYTDSGTTVGMANDYTPSCGYSAAPDVVYEYTAVVTGTHTVSLCGSGFDTILDVLTGSSCPGTTSVGCNDDFCAGNASQVQANLTAGVTYWFVVDGYSSYAGAYTLTVTGPTPPAPGETCETAIALTVPGTVTGTTTTFQNNYDASCPYTGGTAPDVVYSYTPAADQQVTFDLCPSAYDTKLYIYDGVCSGTPIACNDDYCPDFQSWLGCVQLTGGHTYYIVVDGYGSSAGDYTLVTTVCQTFPAPPNDNCANAEVITVNGAQVCATTEGATLDCPALGIPEIWYTFTTTECMDIALQYCGTTTGGSLNAVLFSGSCCGDIIYLSDWEFTTCTDGLITIHFNNLAAGQYWLPVGFEPAGPFCVQVVGTACPPPFVCPCFDAMDGRYVNNTGGYVINDYATVDVPVVVPIQYHITDVNVCVDLNHTYDADLAISLVSPAGTVVALSNHRGGGSDNFTCTSFDDQATTPIASGAAPFTGSFIPDAPLAVLNGENALGTWFVRVYDWAGGDVGVVNTVSVTFQWDYILAVELASFDAIAGDNSVQLRWTTSSETNNDHFEIVRGTETVGRVNARNNATGSTYSWTDGSALNGTTYAYTLVAVDISGGRKDVGTVTAVPNFGAAQVTEYALHQNYPNPFNPTTSIAVDLVEAGRVSLKVYNLMGQEVASLVSGNMSSGRHIVSFDASHLSSGLYLYRLNVNGFSAEKKMLLMK